MTIDNTGERIILEKETPLMIARHFCAYKFSEDFVQGKNVLDVGCGEGYGSYHLSGFAKQVVGMDYDEGIIDYAKSKYENQNLSFEVLDINNLASLNKKFEVVCSFQVIEHFSDPSVYLEGISNLLDKGGIFICSTPNRLDASPNRMTPLNKFHMKEYLFNEFEKLLEGYFGKTEIAGLKRGDRLNFYRMLKKSGLFEHLPLEFNPVQRYFNKVDFTEFKLVKNKEIETALDFIAVCTK